MVSYASLTDHSAITQAFDEFDRLGRELFLLRYGFKEVNESFVVARSSRYDTRALFAAAYEYQHGAAVTPRDISGVSGVASHFTALGYVVVGSDDQKNRERFTSFDAALSHVTIPVENLDAIREFISQRLYAEYYVPASGAYIGLKPRGGKPPHFIAAGYIAYREDDGRARGIDLPAKPALRSYSTPRPVRSSRPAAGKSSRVVTNKPSTPQQRAQASEEKQAFCPTCFLALPATGICPNCDE